MGPRRGVEDAGTAVGKGLRLSLLVGSVALGLTAPAARAQGFLTPPPAPPENPVTAEKAVLGKILFWDEQLSSDGSMACGTCHIPSAGGGDPRIGPSSVKPGPDGIRGTDDDVVGSPGVVGTSAFGHLEPRPEVGLEPQVTGRHSPSNITAAYFDVLFWDGRAGPKFHDPLTGATVIQNGGALEAQSLVPILSDVEMADSGRGWDAVVERLGAVRPLALASELPKDVEDALRLHPDYPSLFARAFGTPEITPVRLGFALATYQRTLVPDQTPFDAFMAGDPSALTHEQQRGLIAFDTTAACAVCHTPPLFSNGGFHALALRPSAEDAGRFAVTGNPQDLGRFKTPSLRNVALKERFFHHGTNTIPTLGDAVAFYSGSGAFDNLDPVLNGLVIPPGDVATITAYLHALTDPRVELELPPFDRPRLRSERVKQNPLPTGAGAVAGTLGRTPRVIATAAPFVGADRFRLGVTDVRPGTFAALRLSLVASGGFAGPGAAGALRAALPVRPVLTRDDGRGVGYATCVLPLTASPALEGVTLDAQWWVRDPASPGGAARSEVLRLRVE